MHSFPNLPGIHVLEKARSQGKGSASYQAFRDWLGALGGGYLDPGQLSNEECHLLKVILHDRVGDVDELRAAARAECRALDHPRCDVAGVLGFWIRTIDHTAPLIMREVDDPVVTDYKGLPNSDVIMDAILELQRNEPGAAFQCVRAWFESRARRLETGPRFDAPMEMARIVPQACETVTDLAEAMKQELAWINAADSDSVAVLMRWHERLLGRGVAKMNGEEHEFVL